MNAAQNLFIVVELRCRLWKPPHIPTTPVAPLVGVCACGGSSTPQPTQPADPRTSQFTTRTITLPGATADGVFMDYLLYDPRTNTVWVPAGNTGSVDVIDVASGKL